MSAKSEFVVMGAVATSFQEPKDIHEAEARLASLKVEIGRIEIGLRDKRVCEKETGRRLTTLEYYAWKRDIRVSLRRMVLERSNLKSWVQMNRPAKFVQPGMSKERKDGEAFRLLWRCGQLLRRLDEEGVDFSEEEKALLTDVTDFTSLKPSELLEQARACGAGNLESLFQFGAMVARATQGDQDAVTLRTQWEQVISQRSRDDEVLLAKLGNYYVEALVAMSRFDEAIAIARSLDQAQADAAYSWLVIARAVDDVSMLAYARELGKGIELAQQGWFFLKLYETTGEDEDLALAVVGPEKEKLLGKKAGRHRILLAKSRVGWGQFEAVRGTLSLMTNTEERIHALACLAEVSEDPNDVELLVASLAEYKPAKLTTMKTVASALSQNGRGHIVVEMLDTISTWYLRCGGYSVLARFMPDRAAELIDRAERVVTSAKITSTTEAAQALFSLVYAQATNGRRPEAVRTAGLIVEKDMRCRALLLLNALSREEAIPEFLEDAL